MCACVCLKMRVFSFRAASGAGQGEALAHGERMSRGEGHVCVCVGGTRVVWWHGLAKRAPRLHTRTSSPNITTVNSSGGSRWIKACIGFAFVFLSIAQIPRITRPFSPDMVEGNSLQGTFFNGFGKPIHLY